MVFEGKVGAVWTLSILSFSWFLAYIWVSPELLTLFGILIIGDITTWIIKGVFHKDLASKTLRLWIMSKLLLLTIPLFAWVMVKIVWVDISFLIKYTIVVLSLGEFYSIIWNIREIASWKKQKEFDVIDHALKWLLSIIKNYLDKFLESNNKK